MFRMKFVPVVITAILLSASAFAGNSSPTFTTIDNPADPTFNVSSRASCALRESPFTRLWPWQRGFAYDRC